MKLATWNVQGAHTQDESTWQLGVKSFVVSSGIDVLCAQEFGLAPGDANHVQAFPNNIDLYAIGTQRRTQYYLLLYEWDTGSHRVNPAIVWKENLTPNPGNAVVWTAPGSNNGRRAIGVTINGRTYYCLHVKSGGGPNTVQDAVGLLNNVNGNANNWVAAGDYNLQPPILGQNLPGNLTIAPPNGNTHHGSHGDNKLDYAVNDFGDNQTGQVQVFDRSLSDHDPVVYQM